MLKGVLLGWALAGLAGCASPGRQTRALLDQPPQVPASYLIENAPFIDQPEGHCGPATLTMAIQAQGLTKSLAEITPQVYTPGNRGSLQMDMVSSARRNGMLAVQIGTMSDMLTEIASGHPVIVFQNLGFSWLPKWHYALAVGYDLPKQELVLHTGPNAFRRESMNRFEHGWKLGGYWGLTVIKPGELAASASELAHLTAATGLEQADRQNEAERAYNSILTRWPKSLGALVGLGNITYKRGDYKSAIRHLKRATELHPDSVIARHNLSIAETAAKR